MVFIKAKSRTQLSDGTELTNKDTQVQRGPVMISQGSPNCLVWFPNLSTMHPAAKPLCCTFYLEHPSRSPPHFSLVSCMAQT